MASSTAKTVAEYLKSIPADRRKSVETVRKIVKSNLNPGLQEVMQYGMISYVIPFKTFPNTYNGQPLAVVSLGAQKNYLVLHVMPVYADAKLRIWFEQAYKASGKKLDMGKGCIRFKTAEDLPLLVMGQLVKKLKAEHLIAAHEKAHGHKKKKAS